MIRRTLIGSASALTAALLLAGCAPATPDPVPTATAPARYVPGAGQEAAAGADEASWESQMEAASAAEAVMGAFVDHDRPYDTWWAEFSSRLTATAQDVWAYTDPRLVPASTLTGPPMVTDAPSSTQVFVDVPTDAGSYALELIRNAAPGAGQGPWQVQTITPPAEPD